MPGHDDPKPTLADYRAARERLAAARDAASEKQQTVVATGDIGAGEANLQGLRAALDEYKAIRSQLTPKDLFVVEFNIEVTGKHQVSLVLPRGISRIDFLRRAMDIFDGEADQPLVWPAQMPIWERSAGFKKSYTEPTKIDVDGYVDGTRGLSLKNQLTLFGKRGMQLATFADVAVAHTAFFIATSQSMFEGNTVRVKGGALDFYREGLAEFGEVHSGPDNDIAAAGSPMPRKDGR